MRRTAGARGCRVSPGEARETPFTASASEHGGQKTAEGHHAASALDENGLHSIGAHIGHAANIAKLSIASKLHKHWCAVLGLNQVNRPGNPGSEHPGAVHVPVFRRRRTVACLTRDS
jgi:hypothetical protein